METKYIIVFAILIVVFIYLYKKNVKSYNKKFIDEYEFPNRLNETIKARYVHLNEDEIELVLKGLKEYFHVCAIANKKMVAMPSQVVDVAWHDFILFTKKYQVFCNSVYGSFLHHTPVEAMKEKTSAQEGIKRAWNICCKREAINPSMPHKLPLLFVLDKKLNIEDGFKYSLDCTKIGGDYCASHIGGGCGGSSCSSGSDGGSSCSSCGGGD